MRMRSCSAGMLRTAWFNASMWIWKTFRNSARLCVLVVHVPAHGEIRTIQLHMSAGSRDRLVFVLHRIGDREHIGFVASGNIRS